MSKKLLAAYERRHTEILVPIAGLLHNYLVNILEGVARIDAVSVRAKTPKSFAIKALKTNSCGELKYENPLVQIQDQVGARINVLFLSDVPNVKAAINDYFHAVEWLEKRPDSEMEFGYFGEHYVLKIPDDAIPEGDEEESPDFFELQIKTLFQHAWSETSHDIGYKSPRELRPLEKRKMAFSAAQAWGADQIFGELETDIVADNDH